MDFGGSAFEHNSVDDTQLFSTVLEQDFTVPLSQPTSLPPHFTQQAGNSYVSSTDRSHGPVRDTAGRLALQRHNRSPLGPRAGSGILKRSPTSAASAGPLKQTLAQALRSVSSVEALEDKVAALSTRVNERFQLLDNRLRTIEADSRVTQEGLRACMDEIEGALDYLRNRIGGDRKDTGDRVTL